MHTPYNRRYNDNNPNRLTVDNYREPGRLVKYGYVAATVDSRGIFATFGHTEGNNRGQWNTAARMEAYDITEWLAKQPWSNGNIGMWGCSATGGSQIQAATTAPPHLKAIFPMSSEFDVYAFRVPGGITGARGADSMPRAGGQSPQEARDANAAPVDADTGRSLLKQAVAQHTGTVESPGYVPYRDSLSETITDLDSKQWWIVSSPHTCLKTINASGIAMYLVANWDEGPTKHGPFFTFNNVKNPKKFIIGPSRHCDWIGVQRQTGFDITIEERRFFDYWLKGIDNGVMDEDPVYYYTYNAPAGAEWASAKQWPLPGEKRVKYYLGDGSLSTAAPTTDGGKDVITVSYTGGVGSAAGGLVYETAPLSADDQITGPPVVNLGFLRRRQMAILLPPFMMSRRTQGGTYNIRASLSLIANTERPAVQQSRLPCTVRRGGRKPLVPGQPVELEFPILPTSIVVKAGHRIRLAITFSGRGTPRIDPAPEVTIYRDPAHKSFLTLPIIGAH
jgi:putative CocE/NonD family hydrolase